MRRFDLRPAAGQWTITEGGAPVGWFEVGANGQVGDSDTTEPDTLTPQLAMMIGHLWCDGAVRKHPR